MDRGPGPDHFRPGRDARHEARSRRRAEFLGMAGGEACTNFLEGIIGRDLVKRTFWFFATIFIFILFRTGSA